MLADAVLIYIYISKVGKSAVFRDESDFLIFQCPEKSRMAILATSGPTIAAYLPTTPLIELGSSILPSSHAMRSFIVLAYYV
jgi:hypothetical protein